MLPGAARFTLQSLRLRVALAAGLPRLGVVSEPQAIRRDLNPRLTDHLGRLL